MAQKSIQIADKPTLDAAKAWLEDSGVGLAAIKAAVSSGAASGSAGGLQIGKVEDKVTDGNGSLPELDYAFTNGSAVVLNNEIHILGSEYKNSNGTYIYSTYHYKYNGSSWVSVSTLPYDFYDGCAVVLNDEIHILGYNSYSISHYKFNGTSWESVSTLPYSFVSGSAVVYNGEIHIFGSGYGDSYRKYHYKYNGTSWESVSTLPFEFYNGSAVVLNNEIHIMKNSTHYKFNGTSWSKQSAIPYCGNNGSRAVVLNNEIHVVGGGDGSSNGVYEYSRHRILSNRYRNIATLLPIGSHILLPNNMDIKYVSDNAIKTADNIASILESGLVEITAQFKNEDDVREFITFY